MTEYQVDETCIYDFNDFIFCAAIALFKLNSYNQQIMYRNTDILRNFAAKLLAVALLLFLPAFSGAQPSGEIVKISVAGPVKYRSGSYRFRDKARELAQKFPGKRAKTVAINQPGISFYADRNALQIGEQTSFFVDKNGADNRKKLAAVLKVIGKHCYVYLEKGCKAKEGDLKRVADFFDRRIYPQTTSAFGSEWKPGIDGDPRITLLLLAGMKGCDGFFYPGDEYPADAQPDSNEREMLYLSIDRMKDVDDFMGHLTAHELQHMIHWNNDSNETYWVEEGLSEYAATFFGCMPWTAEQFFQYPDRNLFDWEDTKEAENYGRAFLFVDYLLTQAKSAGVDRLSLLREIVKCQAAGVTGISEALSGVAETLKFNNVFRDFCAATFLHESFNGAHPYRFSAFVSEKLKKYALRRVMPRKVFKTASASIRGTVSMWSAVGYSFSLQNRPAKLRLKFDGSILKHDKGNNVFLPGLAFTDSAGKHAPKVVWFKTNAGKLERSIRIADDNYDTLLLIVCNQGPMKYLDGDGRLPRVGFQFSLDEIDTRFETLHKKP